jgi:DNA-binding transcriptional MocR family regulator
MSPAHVLQPTYDRLKREITQGVWAQNVRLEPARIAEDYGVSATPVRDGLNLLVGEGLIAFRPGEGYRTRVVTERDLASLLAVNLMLLHGALDGPLAASRGEDKPGSDPDEDYADAVSVLFRDMGLSSGNRVLTEYVERISDRLHQARTREHLVFPDLDQELASMHHARQLGPEAAKAAISAYHERRLAMVGTLAATLP